MLTIFTHASYWCVRWVSLLGLVVVVIMRVAFEKLRYRPVISCSSIACLLPAPSEGPVL